jgi:thiamine-phosphate diphosphorylase
MPRALAWVYLVTDRRRLAPAARTTAGELAALEAQLEDAMAAGVDVIQLRESDLDGAVLRALAVRVAGRARATSTRVLVNDRADVARAAGADGVHVKADGPDASRVRPLLPAGSLLGRSTHSLDEVRRGQGADYLLYGTVFDTGSKPGAAARGVEALREAVAASPAPVIAIGGIDAARAARCAAAGAAGVAAIGLFLPEGCAPGALGAARAVAALRAALEARPAP